MRPIRKQGFSLRAKTQLTHLRSLDKRRRKTQENWQTFFKQLREKIKELKTAETKNSGAAQGKLRAELNELERIQNNARNAFIKKKS